MLPPNIDWEEADLTNLLLQARTELAELKGFSHALPNPMLLMSSAILREAVASSNIENINTTVAQALQMQLFPEAQQREPDKEVLRYREAMLWGFAQLARLPISTRLLLGIQKQLLPDSYGYRTTQNHIINSITGEVLYTPPAAIDIPGLMGNLENFIHQEGLELDPLIKVAITHYQFEAIHPFGDGNGRTGRILMVLQLLNEGILNYPILYISGYVNRHRSEYYRLLRQVSMNEDWLSFIRFMLTGFHQQAKSTRETFYAVMELYRQAKEEMQEKCPKIYSADLVDILFSFPVLTPGTLAEKLSIHRRTASRYLEELRKNELLADELVGKYHLYINRSLISLFTEKI
jgi:Fic family protein